MRKPLSLVLVLLLALSLAAQSKIGGTGKLGGTIKNGTSAGGGGGPNGFSAFKTITIDHTKVANTNQTDFPMLFSGTFTYLKTTGNGGDVTDAEGDDIIFTSDSGCTTNLKFEQESYAASSGLVNYWVKIPTLSASVDTVIYLCYGKSAITTFQGDPTNVWTNSFAGVWHLGNGSTLSSLNSVTGNSGTITGATASTGKIDGAGNWVATSDKIVTDLTTNATQRTYSAWTRRHGEGGGGHGRVFQKGTTVSKETLFVESPLEASTYEFLSNHNATVGDWTFPKPSIDVFHHIVLAYDSGSTSNNPVVWVDSVSQTINLKLTPAGTPTGGTEAYLIGNRLTNDRGWDGDLDEFRIADVLRSADWVTTEYNNQFSPSTFYTVT